MTGSQNISGASGDPRRVAHTRRSLAAQKGWALRRGEWEQYLNMHAHQDCLSAFARIFDMLDGPTYWRLLGELWTRTEGFHGDKNVWRDLLSLHPADRGAAMDEAERQTLSNLPPEIRVFRGAGGEQFVRGFSWTLNLEQAEWFARRFAVLHKTPLVACGRVRKSNVIAYLDHREEREIVTMPESVERVSVVKFAEGES
jgi:hypothetical protein